MPTGYNYIDSESKRAEGVTRREVNSNHYISNREDNSKEAAMLENIALEDSFYDNDRYEWV